MVETDKYMVPLEVQSQLKLLWSNCPELLDRVWGRALNTSMSMDCKWKIFFSQAILVPPTRFRPRSKLGDATTEHAQNHHLSLIITTNESIAKLLSDSNSAVEGTENVMSKQVTLWITLQNSVNCYMDSGKDPNPLGSQGIPPGIKQILERKEGLFRKNMMGKRVNFCCRSVISPDPYMGTNEVGIPVKFAKVLHYPTPVCTWNVKLMRELVERGPNEYPGPYSILFLNAMYMLLLFFYETWKAR
jgi:DNA-directed RNA polymerase I subunit RPA1